MKNHIRKPLCILLSLLTVLFCLPASMSAYADEPEYFYILGDINADDCVTLKDASVMQRVDVGLEIIAESQYAICDVDGNGKFSLADAYIVQKYALGIIAAYPANQSGYRIGDKVPFDLGSDTDSEDTQFLGYTGYNRSRTSASAATHTGGNECHTGAIAKHIADVLNTLLGSLTSFLRFVTCSKSFFAKL